MAADDDAAYKTLAALPRRLITFLRSVPLTEDADVALAAGRITVCGKRTCDGDALVVGDDVVCLDGERLQLTRGTAGACVFAYHKPRNMCCDRTTPAPRGLGGVEDGFGYEGQRALHPVGQLDKDTSGLLLFCDHGDLTRLLLAPGCTPKRYHVGFDAAAGSTGLSAEQLDALRDPTPRALAPREGRKHAGAPTDYAAFDSCEPLAQPALRAEAATPAGCTAKARFEVAVTIRSGQNHVVKRVFMERAKVAVRTLHRQGVGGLDLGALGIADRPGAWCKCTSEQVARLWDGAGGTARLLELKRAELTARLRDAPEDRAELLARLSERRDAGVPPWLWEAVGAPLEE